MKPGPQDDGGELVFVDVAPEQNFGLRLGLGVAVQPSHVGWNRFVGAVMVPRRIHTEGTDLDPPLQAPLALGR